MPGTDTPRLFPGAFSKNKKVCGDPIYLLTKVITYQFSVRVIANEQFNESVLQPILLASGGIADTSELFIRAYQMYGMFGNATESRKASVSVKKADTPEYSAQIRSELKIGKLV